MNTENIELTDEQEEQRRRRHRERIERMRREKERILRRRKVMLTVLPFAIVLMGAALFVLKGTAGNPPKQKQQTQSNEEINPSGRDGSEERQLGGNGEGNRTGRNGDENQPEGNSEENQPGGNSEGNQSGGNDGECQLGGNSEENQPGGNDGGRQPGENKDDRSQPGEKFGGANPSGGNGDGAAQIGGSTGGSQIGSNTDGTSVQYTAQTTAQTEAPPEEVNSTNVVFIDLESGNILAQKDYRTVVNPASMTKVLTVLVAAEHVSNLEDTFTITIDITDYSFSHDCSSVGFAVGEEVTVRDLFYGTILPSGGDAAVALATYVAGSHESFVAMMNEKAEALGLSDTAHFTNCVGIYDAEHHCTVYDMAMIMEAALDNELCREVLNAHIYTTSKTSEHPEGIEISNWFLRKIEDKDTGGEMVCAKTGYVQQSGNCAVSYGVDKSGKGYVCATTGAHSSWRCIYDHVALYKKYAQE